jgi:hypothetical protein
MLLIIVFGLLIGSVATLEFDELVHLRDNTSNDFTLTTGHISVDTVKNQNQTPVRQSQFRPIVSHLPYVQPTGGDPQRLVSHHVDDLLHSLCIQRT